MREELSTNMRETLWQDEEFVLSRSVQQGAFSPLLAMAPASAQPAPATLTRLEHAYALRDELDAAWAARPLALTHHQGRPTLVLDDPGGELLERLLGRPWEVTPFLRVAIGLAVALGRLHARGLIHKDVKPANILTNAATGEVWLTGFGIASRLPRERQAPAPPDVITGTLAYMAPEQTGRMNRSVDSRSDLYAYGVTVYEMLTGSLPFTATDPMEWIHCHIARPPTRPSERVQEIPGPIDAIVMKFLAKTAEERYQTAAGVEADLRRCLAEWESLGRIDRFPLGTQDVPDRLLIPERLYGREPEINTLLAAFDRVVTDGTSELVLVSGYAGIGKSSVVNELHQALVPSGGLFASGKFDQYKRDIPYATLAQAFQNLVRPILGQSEEDLGRWRDAMRQALGPNGQLIVNLIPELELVIGKQPPLPDLPPQDRQTRFQLVFRRFLGVFARPEHPLVLFLDDLQWLDTATLALLERLVTEPEVRHLLLVCAYRDNEVSPLHPLMRTLGVIRNAGGRVQEIVLAPLMLDDVERLVADALNAERKCVRSLAELVFEKTEGNPFFAIQFTTALAEEGLLVFDPDGSAWQWDMDRIRAKRITDNVVDLMVGKLNRLPGATQEALKQLACLGNGAQTTTLGIVLGVSEEEVHAALWEVVRAGLVLRWNNDYSFLHDRVQEATYALVAEGERAAIHLRIGRLLAACNPSEKLEETIFDIVNQLNRGIALITSEEERDQVAELNLMAGKRAKTSTAYAAALTYFAAGRVLLAEDSWERQYRLTFDLEFHRAECEYLTVDPKAAEERLSILSHRARNVVDQAAVTCVQVTLYTALDRIDRAVAVCLECLARVGLQWSANPTLDEVRQEYERVWRQLRSRSIEELVDLPPMTDPVCRATLDILTAVLPTARSIDENLFLLIVGRMANLSFEYGNSDGSCLGYVLLGAILGPYFGDYRTGVRLGKLGLDLTEKVGLDRFKARVYLNLGSNVVFWTRHLRTSLELLRRAFDLAQETGGLTFAGYSSAHLVTNLLASGDRLGDVQREAETRLESAREARLGLVVAMITGQLMFVRTLRGLTPAFSSFNDAGFDEDSFERHVEGDSRLALAACWYWIRKLQAHFFAEDFVSAVEAAAKAQVLLWTTRLSFETAEYHFYGALARAAHSNAASADERPKHLAALAAHHKQLTLWAENCPENFANRAALVAAEIARLEGREPDAERLYEEAIRSAHEHGFAQNEGLANELAARFYAARGFETIAHAYFRNARSCYLRGGADGKVRQLDQTHPHLREEPASLGPTTTIGAPVAHLDLATVVKVSQAVSGEIDLEQLIDTLMVIALEHAGGDRGLLILPRGGELRIEAEATTGRDRVEVRLRQARVTLSELPESVLHYVIRTQESVMLDDASAPNQFSGDEYIRQKHARSVLCLPLIKQSKLIGVLYLENNLTPHAFTPARIAVLKLLASQAAISLENAHLYTELQQSEDHLRLAIDTIPMMVGIVRPDGSTDFLNQRWLDYTGLSLEHGLGQGWQAAIHPEDRARFVDEWRAALAAREPLETEARVQRADGECRWFLIRAVPLRDEKGNIVKWYGTGTDIEDRKQAEEIRAAQARQAGVRADVSAALSKPAHSGEILHGAAEAIVRHLDAAFARIWTLNKEKNMLELQASAGMYTHLDGPHSRIQVGKLKIGLIAQEKKPHLTNDVLNDPRVSDKAWAQNEGIVSFAGYPLIVQDRVVGVMAMFARQRLSAAILDTLASVADSIAQGIERKQTEEKIRQSEAYLAEAQRLSHTGSFGLSVSNGEIFWSEETFRIFECDRAVKPTLELVLQRVHPEDVAAVQETIARASRDGTDLDFEHRYVVPHGSVKYVHVLARAVRDKRGDLEYVGAVMDVTAPKLSQQALESAFRDMQALQDQHRLVIDSIPGLVWSTLPDGSADFLNKRWLDYTGLSLEEALGWGWRAGFHPEDSAILDGWSASLAVGEPFEAEVRMRRADGAYNWFLIRSVPLRDELGNIVRWYGTNTDIEDRKQAEEALHQAQAALAHVTRVTTLGELTASIAHEVNQPLAGVITNAQACLRWLGREVADVEEARAAVERIIRDGHRASAVIQRIRALATKTAPHKARLDLNDVIHEVVRLVHREVLGHRVSLRTALAAALPPVLGDRVQLQQVLMNLVLNGIEAMAPVTERPRELLIRAHQLDADRVCVAVQDAGIGIDPAYVDRLFHAFFTTKPNGMGMGLSISRSIIEAHGGRLWASHNVGPGATVQFTLPLLSAHQA
jgi:PAS domain S-box-containing protein